MTKDSIRTAKYPSKDFLEALKELEDLENSKIEIEGFNNINDFIDDALNKVEDAKNEKRKYKVYHDIDKMFDDICNEN